MRVWILATELPSEIAGGIGRYAWNFARRLGADGHEATLLAPSSEPREEILGPGARLIAFAPNAAADSFPCKTLNYWAALSWQAAKETEALARREGPPDIIESQEYQALPYYLLHNRLASGGPLADTPVMLHTHSPDFCIGWWSEEPMRQFPRYGVNRMERFCFAAADAVLCPSRYMAEDWQKRLCEPVEVERIPYPLGSDQRPDVQPGKNRTLLCPGRLETRKGSERLMDACARLWENGADFTLKFAGGDCQRARSGGSVGDYIRARHRKWTDSGRAQIMGSLPHSQLQQEMAQAAAVVIPSIWDNFPNTCMEAMSLGKAVIASVHGGQAEMIQSDGEDGLLFDWGRPGSFAEAALKALAMSHDERARMGAAAQERIFTLCDPGSVAQARLESFQRVIDKCVRPRRFPIAWTPPISEPLRKASGKSGLVSVALLPEAVETRGALERLSCCELEILELAGGAEDSLDAAARARGEFFLCLGAGSVEPTFFEQALSVLSRYENVAYVYAWARIGKAPGAIAPGWSADLPYMLGSDMAVSPALFRTADYLDARPAADPEDAAYADWEARLRLASRGATGVCLPEPLFHIAKPCSPHRESALLAAERIAERFPDLYGRYGDELFSLQNANGPAFNWPGMAPYFP